MEVLVVQDRSVLAQTDHSSLHGNLLELGAVHLFGRARKFLEAVCLAPPSIWSTLT